MSKFCVAVLSLWLCSGMSMAASEGIDSAKLKEAVQKSIDLLQKCGPIFVKNGACTSCHHQSLPAMAISVARQRSFRINESVVQEQLQASATLLNARREIYLQVIDVGGGADTISYSLIGMAAENYPSGALTDAMVYYLKATQASDGHWRTTIHRPPLEYSDISTTAVSLRAIQLYAPKESGSNTKNELTAPLPGCSDPLPTPMRKGCSNCSAWDGPRPGGLSSMIPPVNYWPSNALMEVGLSYPPCRAMHTLLGKPWSPCTRSPTCLSAIRPTKKVRGSCSKLNLKTALG